MRVNAHGFTALGLRLFVWLVYSLLTTAEPMTR